MSTQYPDTETWLSLSEAAKRLNVHPTTLRRWADNGDIPCLLTPGGHRRFALSDLQAFAKNRRRLRITGGLEKIWAERALVQTRESIIAHDQQPWLTAFDDKTRQEHRQLGRQLMGLTLQYLSDPEGNGSLLAQARAIGEKYGRMSREMGLPLTEALQAAIFFRDTLVEVALQLPEEAHLQPEANVRLVRRINQLLNEVHLAIAAAYESGLEE